MDLLETCDVGLETSDLGFHQLDPLGQSRPVAGGDLIEILDVERDNTNLNHRPALQHKPSTQC